MNANFGAGWNRLRSYRMRSCQIGLHTFRNDFSKKDMSLKSLGWHVLHDFGSWTFFGNTFFETRDYCTQNFIAPLLANKTKLYDLVIHNRQSRLDMSVVFNCSS